jgi:quercetin dioxygenase-like cupin family protein
VARSLRLGVLLVMTLLPVAFAADDHVVVSPAHLKWGPLPPAFPKGGEIAVVMGDPSKVGQFVLQSQVPAGYKIAAHTHPGVENVTVLSGTFHIGMGEKFDDTKGQAVKAGGFVSVPKGMVHYAWFSEPTVIQVHGEGPFTLTYVNPADDPSKSK